MSEINSMEITSHVKHMIEKRDGYGGNWYPIKDQIQANLIGKIVLNNFVYLDQTVACRIVTFIDGDRTVPSRPVNINMKRGKQIFKTFL